jgi:hypothetical protein
MICNKCQKDILETWKTKVTYNGIDRHHNPPQFMMIQWKGEMYNLCRECHKMLHHKFIIPIMNKISGVLRYNGSEHWLWQSMSPKQREECREAIYLSTKRWIEDGNTTTT